MAMSSVEEAKQKFTELFREADTDGSGELDLEEFKCLLEKSGYTFTDSEVQKHFSSIDIDGDNTISLEVFIQAMTGIPMVDHRRAMWRKAFLAWDADNSGTVNRDEMRQVFRDVIGRELSEAELDKVFARFDKNADGEIDWTEFADYFASLTKHFL